MNGWKCPECGRVFAPHVDECKYCGGTVAPTITPQPYEPPPYIPSTTPKPFPHVQPYTVPPDHWWRWPLVTWTITTDNTQLPLTVLY